MGIPPEINPLEPAPHATPEPGRPPHPVRPDLWCFSPSRDSQGGTAWWLELADFDLLIDCPGFTAANLAFLRQRAARRPPRSSAADPAAWIVLSGRDGHGRCRRWQQALDWPVLVQEQEAYLLPGVASLHRFGAEHSLADGVRLLWTPGPSPGACVLHVRRASDPDGLFCGRLLVPVSPGRLVPLRSRRCFHWPRQLRSVQRLRDWLPVGSPDWIATGAGLGALRGERLVRQGDTLLANLDLLSPFQQQGAISS
jgi:glyoxylase-like metal-dependent hydrolase (beta-lactamase superfamily II)